MQDSMRTVSLRTGPLVSTIVLLFCLIVGATGGPLQAGGLRIAHPYGSGSVFDDWIQNFSRRAEVGLNQKIEVYPGGTLGSSRGLFEAVKLGSVEFALIPAEIISREVPDFEVLSLPTVFENAEDARRANENEKFLKILSNSAEAIGVIPLGFGWTFWGIASISKPISEPSDLKGQRVRTANSPAGKLMGRVGKRLRCHCHILKLSPRFKLATWMQS